MLGDFFMFFVWSTCSDCDLPKTQRQVYTRMPILFIFYWFKIAPTVFNVDV